MDALTTLDNQKRDLARLDIPTLIERAREALDEGGGDDAVTYLRTAVRRAPLRQDLRELLVRAMEQRSMQAAPAAPRPIPRSPRAPLFDDPSDDGEGPEAQIEEIAGGLAEPTPVPRPGLQRSERAPGVRRAPVHTPRRRRRELSTAVILAVVGGLLMVGVAVGGIWAVIDGKSHPKSGQAADTSEKKEGLGQDEQKLIDAAADYERQNLFVLAIEKLNLLPDGTDKKKLLAETYARQGEAFSRTKKYNEAREAFDKALENDPKSPTAAFNLGYTYYMLGRQQQPVDREASRGKLDQAEKYLKTALDLEPAKIETLNYLALIEIARANQPAAGNYLRRIIEIDPTNPAAKKARERLAEMGLKE